MLNDLPPEVRQVCEADLVGRLQAGGHKAVAAEWELLALRQMSLGGTMRLAPAKRQGVPDAIFQRPGLQAVVVEVTALSDADLEERYAEDELGTLFYKALIRVSGGHVGAFDVHTQWPMDGSGLPTPGLPRRSMLHKFMGSREVRDFLRAVAADPTAGRHLIHRNGTATTTVVFRPGGTFSSGSVAGYAARRFNPHNRKRLLRKIGKKVKQVGDSDLRLPAVLVLCDADCRMLRERTRQKWEGPDAFQTISEYISGREGISLPGPGRLWVLQHRAPQQTTTFNAVLVLTVEENRRSWTVTRTERSLTATVIRNEGTVKFPLADEALSALVDSLVSNVPTLQRAPMNAKRARIWSDNEGGGSISGGRVRLPLLAFQDFLAGRTSRAQFVKHHEFLMQHIERLIGRGQAIAAARVIPAEHDQDDDWIELDFSGADPRDLQHLLANRGK